MQSENSEARVTALFVKSCRGEPMLSADAAGLTLVRRQGIVGDVHADPLGPRQVLLVARESLDALGLSAASLRGNIITEGLALDDLPSGTVLHVGDTAAIRLTHRCEVCAHIGETAGLKSLKPLNGKRGYLGVILEGGTVDLDARIALGFDRYSWVPEHVLVRALWVIKRIPRGRVVPYAMLIRLIGAPRGYMRALPRAVVRAAEYGLPAHRVVTSRGEMTRVGPNQARELAAEEIDIYAGAVERLERATWRPRSLYLKRLTSRPGQMLMADEELRSLAHFYAQKS